MHRWITMTLILTLMLLAPARPEAAFDETKLIAAVKILMYRAPCCGACAQLDPEQARCILAYLQGETNPTGRQLWANLGDKILAELDKIDPREAGRVRARASRLQGAR